jgi:hypothetical protein
MSLLAHIYVAHDEEAVSYDTTPDQFTDRAHYEGFTVGELSILWSIMRDVEWDVSVLVDFPRLPQVEGRRQIFRLPTAMATELAALSTDRVASVSSAWAATEELLGWPPETAGKLVGDMVYLARRATETGRSLYLWNCI